MSKDTKGVAETPSTKLLNPRTESYDFSGPPGALAVTFGVPFLTYALYFGCSETAGGCPPPYEHLLVDFTESVSSLAWWKGLWDTEAAAIYGAWYAFTVVAWFLLPGDWVEGVQMRNGLKKKYKINGSASF